MLIVSQKILSQVQTIDSSYITLTGLVKDTKHNPIAFATVSLAEQKTSTILHTTITDSLGQFSFITKPNNRYKIIITAVGFTDTTLYNINSNTTISVGTIILSQKDNILSSVVISAQKPVLEKKIDRLVFNISSNMALGNTALDILTKAPGVVLLPNETITLLGKKGVQIFINDRPSKMDSKDLMALLKSLAADDVKQIEIITNPSARYDAQGVSGIINIVLKRGYAEGYKLRLYKNYGQGTYHKYNAGSQLSYSTKKWSVFGNYGYQNQINREDNIINRSFTISNNTSKFNQYNWAKIDYNTHTARAGIDYSINNRSTISTLFIGSFYKEAIPQQNTTYLRNQSSNTIDSSFINHNVSNNKRNDLSFNLNFFTKLDSMQSSFSTDIDYAAFSIGSLVDYNNYFYNKNAVLKDSLLLKSNTPIDVSILSGKFDIVKIWRHNYRIEFGFKGSMVNNKSNVDFSIFKNGNYKSDSLRSNRFDYQESIHAGYVNLSKSFEKLSIQLGIRGEKTYTQGKSITLNNIVKGNYFNLFPSAFISYDLVSAKHQLSFSYSRRIERPYYQDLNPFVYFVDPYTSIQGNPFLLPQYTNAFELSYTFKSKYLFSGFFNQTSNIITPISIQNDTTKTTITKTGNLSNARQWGITLEFPQKN